MEFDNLELQSHEGKAKKRAPFPLENIDEELAEIYFKLNSIKERIHQAKVKNAVNTISKRKKLLNHMSFKINTLLGVTKALVFDLECLKF